MSDVCRVGHVCEPKKVDHVCGPKKADHVCGPRKASEARVWSDHRHGDREMGQWWWKKGEMSMG